MSLCQAPLCPAPARLVPSGLPRSRRCPSAAPPPPRRGPAGAWPPGPTKSPRPLPGCDSARRRFVSSIIGAIKRKCQSPKGKKCQKPPPFDTRSRVCPSGWLALSALLERIAICPARTTLLVQGDVFCMAHLVFYQLLGPNSNAHSAQLHKLACQRAHPQTNLAVRSHYCF